MLGCVSPDEKVDFSIFQPQLGIPTHHNSNTDIDRFCTVRPPFALTPGAPSWKHDPTESVHKRLWKSVKLWSFYVDIEESLGTVTSTMQVYDRIIELKVATPAQRPVGLLLQAPDCCSPQQQAESVFFSRSVFIRWSAGPTPQTPPG